MRLLVVEDNIINQQVAQEMLSNEGALVELAENGQLGVEAVHRAIAQGQGFDAVLMDIQMPVMDGYSATRVLRQDASLAGLPIVAMTANAMASDRDACLAAGMNAHVGKPFKLTELVTLLQHLTQSGSSLHAPKPEGASLSPSQPNHPLYARVLQSYLSDIASQPDQLEAALKSSDWELAARLLHTLKGLSATVGASYMAAVARQAELSIKAIMAQGVNSSALQSLDTQALADRFRASVASTLSVMEKVAKTCEANFANLDTAVAANSLMPDGQESLRQLLHLLKTSDMSALEVFESLQQNPSFNHTDEFKRLTNAMLVFDFSQAAQSCESLLNATRS